MATTRSAPHQRNIGAKARRFLSAARAHAHHYTTMEGGTELDALVSLRDELTAATSTGAGMWIHLGDVATALHVAATASRPGDRMLVRFGSSRPECLRALNEEISDQRKLADLARRLDDGGPSAADPFEGLA